MRSPFFGRLYLVTHRAGLEEDAFFKVVEAAVKGGVSCVQLREKDVSDDDYYYLAKRMKACLKPYSIPLFLNDRLEIALRVGAEGIHVGQQDEAVQTVRRVLGPHALIGLSIDKLEHCRAQDLDCVNYIAASPVFPSQTKKDTEKPLGLVGLRQISQATKLPTLAIGGIQLSNAARVMEEGASGIAVSSAIMQAEDPYRATQELANCISEYF